MLITLEVCYEFYLRGFSFEPIDLYESDATKFLMNEERKSLRPLFSAIPGLGEAAALSLGRKSNGPDLHLPGGTHRCLPWPLQEYRGNAAASRCPGHAAGDEPNQPVLTKF